MRLPHLRSIELCRSGVSNLCHCRVPSCPVCLFCCRLNRGSAATRWEEIQPAVGIDENPSESAGMKGRRSLRPHKWLPSFGSMQRYHQISHLGQGVVTRVSDTCPALITASRLCPPLHLAVGFSWLRTLTTTRGQCWVKEGLLTRP